jgi:FkbM family methyltransferase
MLDSLLPLVQAPFAQQVTLAGMRVHVPGSLPIRLSVVMGNLRMQRMLDSLLHPGATVIDVGANIGYNTLYAAHCVGPQGCVYALEPAQDNLTVLYTNIFANQLENVLVLPYAAGSAAGIREFYLRGDISAVNSLFHDNFYAEITDKIEVLAAPLDELLSITPDLVKIDVEGGELDVLHGMTRMLQSPDLRLIIEWHPTLQQAAGYTPDELPRFLMDQGFTLRLVTHTRTSTLHLSEIASIAARLLHARRPVELLATR